MRGKLKDKAWLLVEENEVHIYNEEPRNNPHAQDDESSTPLGPNTNPDTDDDAPPPDLPQL